MVREIIATNDAPKAIGPYSQAVKACGMVFISGQIPIDPKTGLVVHSDIKTQTKLVMENVKAIITAAGCAMSDIVKATIYLEDMADFAVVNEVYGGYFPVDPPARATVEVSRLPRDVAIEMDFIACKG